MRLDNFIVFDFNMLANHDSLMLFERKYLIYLQTYYHRDKSRHITMHCQKSGLDIET